MVKAVIFDMDGLMFDTETLSMNMWIKAALDQNYDMKLDVALKILGSNKESIYNFFKDYFKNNKDFDVDRYMEDYYRYMDEYLFKKGPEKKFFIKEILDFLKENNILTAVASSSELNYINNNLEKTDLDRYIDEKVSGSDVKQSKPFPDIFLEAARKLGVNPEECIVLEDSKNGVIAGKSAGMKVIMIPDLYNPEDDVKNKVDYIAKDLEVAKKIIEDKYLR